MQKTEVIFLVTILLGIFLSLGHDYFAWFLIRQFLKRRK